MTARFLLHLREWDHRISNTDTDQWNTREGGGDYGTIRFKKTERHTTQWSINDILGDDPLLKPVETEVNPEHKSSGAVAALN